MTQKTAYFRYEGNFKLPTPLDPEAADELAWRVMDAILDALKPFESEAPSNSITLTDLDEDLNPVIHPEED